jgi:hypothetical protein
MASVMAYVLLFTAVVDAKAIDQAIAYLLMLAALFITYLAH